MDNHYEHDDLFDPFNLLSRLSANPGKCLLDFDEEASQMIENKVNKYMEECTARLNRRATLLASPDYNIETDPEYLEFKSKFDAQLSSLEDKKKEPSTFLPCAPIPHPFKFTTTSSLNVTPLNNTLNPTEDNVITCPNFKPTLPPLRYLIPIVRAVAVLEPIFFVSQCFESHWPNLMASLRKRSFKGLRKRMKNLENMNNSNIMNFIDKNLLKLNKIGHR
jgi:hypothetical protein